MHGTCTLYSRSIAVLSFSTWVADANFCKMFHNFHMDDRIRKHSGVDVSPQLRNHFTSSSVEKFRWSKLFMGMLGYISVRHYYWCKESALGDPARITKNPMRYDRIRLNLPCMDIYDPQLPKLMKWNDLAGRRWRKGCR